MFQWHEDTFALAVGARLLLSGWAVRNQASRFGDRAWALIRTSS